MTKTLDPQMLEHFVAAWTAMFLAWGPFVDRKALQQKNFHALLSAIGVDPPPAEGTYSQMAEADQRGRNFLVGCALMLLGPLDPEGRARIMAGLKKFLEGQPTVSVLLAMDPPVRQLLPRDTPQPLEVQPAEVAYKHVLSLLMAQCLPTPKPLDDDDDEDQ